VAQELLVKVTPAARLTVITPLSFPPVAAVALVQQAMTLSPLFRGTAETAFRLRSPELL
jgi:hypothetical protein